MRTTVNKEIPRDSLEFGAELGSGEFGSVFEGERSRCVAHDQAFIATGKLKMALREKRWPLKCCGKV